MKSGKESFLIGHNAEYVEQMLARWVHDPQSVPEDWRRYFDSEAGADGAIRVGGPRFAPESIFHGGAAPGAWTGRTGGSADAYEVKLAGVQRLVQGYRDRGHECADLDPLGTDVGPYCQEPGLDEFGLTAGDLDTLFVVPGFADDKPMTLADIRTRLRHIYNRSLGVEVAHITNRVERNWVRGYIERESDPTITAQVERRAFAKALRAERLEKFLHTKFLGTKRFSLEGCEGLIPALDFLIETAPGYGVNTFIVGMAHRGRINVLANVFNKSLEMIFSEFEDVVHPELAYGSGDVKYHLGFNTHLVTAAGKEVYLALTPNPSHLEIVNPVVEGRVRARQDRQDVGARERIVPVLIHGDAAIAGQGVTAETFNFSKLTGYRTGGTVHVIINNQLGFTTAPRFARSTPYATDIARSIEAPVFHVNGDDIPAILAAVHVAFRFRQRFKKDVLIDILCYRRYGHSETDEPGFTQPLLYQKIAEHPGVATIYGGQLVERGLLSEAEIEAQTEAIHAELTAAMDAEKKGHVPWGDISTLSGPWSGLRAGTGDDIEKPVDTAVPRELIGKLTRSITTVPSGFTPHRKISRLLDERREMGEGKRPVDWGMGEHLAIGSLLWQNHPVRLSGQDSRRGTFSHRHAVLTDQDAGKEYIPLSYLRAGQSPFYVWDSSLSEASVLGFEYGYSLDSPHTLTIWEAQFGDFANGAQVVIDQFLASAETKWRRMSGLVLLLPHGYEGQGPEHSSARVERYLQLAAEYNMEIANATTPAQFFHLLRRQMVRPFRKPLIVFTPKSLLRHKLAVSSIDEFADGRFHEVLTDPQAPDPASVARVVFCTGKVYYDLIEAREARGVTGVSINRIEQLYPFPARAVGQVLDAHPGAEVVWVQEEPKNMGAWTHLVFRFGELRGGTCNVGCVARPEAAAPAVGYAHKHKAQQARVVADALGIELE